jgi:hypothetical protein
LTAVASTSARRAASAAWLPAGQQRERHLRGGLAAVPPERVAAEQRAERDRLRLHLVAGGQGKGDPPLPGLPVAARADHRADGCAGRAAQHFGLDRGIAAIGADPDRDDERAPSAARRWRSW